MAYFRDLLKWILDGKKRVGWKREINMKVVVNLFPGSLLRAVARYMAKTIAVEATAPASPTTSTAASSEIPDAVRALAGEVAVLAAFEATIAPCERIEDTILQFKKSGY